LRQSRTEQLRQAQLRAFSELGLKTEKEPSIRTITLTDKAAGTAKITSAPSAGVSVTSGEGRTHQFEHSPQGLLTAITEQAGLRVPYNRDTQHRLAAILKIDELADTYDVTHADGTHVHFLFNDEKIIKASNETCTVKLEYDDKGHIISEDTDGQIVKYLYHFERDKEHRLNRISDWAGNKYEIDYEPSGALGGVGGVLVRRARKGEHIVGEIVPNNIKQTGSCLFTDSADETYDAIRASTTDVEAIARNTGIKHSNIQKVKNHLFFDEHLLDKYVDYGVPAKMNRFDSELAIANAWERLKTGHFTPEDIQLLKHEMAEAWYMNKYGQGYTKAHDAAHKRFPAPELGEK